MLDTDYLVSKLTDSKFWLGVRLDNFESSIFWNKLISEDGNLSDFQCERTEE